MYKVQKGTGLYENYKHFAKSYLNIPARQSASFLYLTTQLVARATLPAVVLARKSSCLPTNYGAAGSKPFHA